MCESEQIGVYILHKLSGVSHYQGSPLTKEAAMKTVRALTVVLATSGLIAFSSLLSGGQQSSRGTSPDFTTGGGSEGSTSEMSGTRSQDMETSGKMKQSDHEQMINKGQQGKRSSSGTADSSQSESNPGSGSGSGSSSGSTSNLGSGGSGATGLTGR